MVRRLCCLGLLLVLAASASPALAQDWTAYARLLEAHVRPATIAGIRLQAVDYAALREDPHYARALTDLAAPRPEALATDAARIAFWINAYNLLAIKAVADRYPVRSITTRRTSWRARPR